MHHEQQPYIYKFSIDALTTAGKAEELQNALKNFAEITRVDINMEKRLLRLISFAPLDMARIKQQLMPLGFHLQLVSPNIAANQAATTPSQPTVVNVCIDGMTCRSCELTIERKWKKLAGVKKVDVNAATGKARLIVNGKAPSIYELQAALTDNKYRVHQNAKKVGRTPTAIQRLSFWRLVGLFALVLFIGHIFSRLGLLKGSFAVGSAMSFGAILVLGLVAASSSCIAVTGGLLLSAAAKFNERYTAATRLGRMRPVFFFVAGRIASYTVLGGLLGVVGSVLTPSPLVTALLIILAAVYMLIMGLDMLHVAPSWLKGILPRLPKALSHRIMDAEGKEHPFTPFALGAATFFLPCGFTQALQLYAITTGSFATGATTLLAFALGTAPALLALGFASSALKGKAGRFFFQFSGALVVVLGLWNIQNGLTVAGYPLRWPSFGGQSVAQAKAGGAIPSGVRQGNAQVIKMGFDDYGDYAPKHFTLQAGVPVRWEIDGTKAVGCSSVLVARKFGIQKLLQPGINVIEFTPKEPGTVQFSCSMGMMRGSFTVVPAS